MSTRERDARHASPWHTPTCPNGCRAHITEEARNRVHVTSSCDSCGQRFMTDRATGRLITRLPSV